MVPRAQEAWDIPKSRGQLDLEFFYEVIGIIGKFGLPEPEFSQVLFAIDEEYLRPALLAELLIDHRIEFGNFRINR